MEEDERRKFVARLKSIGWPLREASVHRIAEGPRQLRTDDFEWARHLMHLRCQGFGSRTARDGGMTG
jgi:hypothetical protein